MSLPASSLRVFLTGAEEARKRSLPKGKPSHWSNASGSHFHNPWPSESPDFSIKDVAHFLAKDQPRISRMAARTQGLPVTKPVWRVGDGDKPDLTKIQATWLGHACFYVEMPATSPNAKRGPRILFDPVFSDRCSPFQFFGPLRFTPTPCQVGDIPEVDAIVISHNHYDHLDTATIKALFSRNSESKPHVFAPLGNESWFLSLGNIPKSHIHCVDWWDSLRLESSGSKGGEDGFLVDLTCTPAQHMTGRGLFDRGKTLWASWVVSTPAAKEGESGDERKLYFAGDTAYRSVNSDDVLDDESLPFCPAFKEIGEKFGGVDLALIPIGAYRPRKFMSRVHVSPPQSVHIFKDVRAKKALGMHWGTWALTTEDPMEPATLLAQECKKQGLEEGQFDVCGVGETRSF